MEQGEGAAEDVIRRAYAAFNARDVDGALAQMDPEVDWPNVMEGKRARGHEEVRRYWLLQWSQTEPHVEPRHFTVTPDGRIAVDVHQTVRSKTGEPLADRMVRHVFTLRNGFVVRMDVEEPD